MASNEELLREIALLKAENQMLRTHRVMYSDRPIYDTAKLMQIPEFENVFWEVKDDGCAHFIHTQWVSMLGTIARSILFPQYAELLPDHRRIRRALCTDLSENEYRQYTEFLDDVFTYIVARASTVRKEAGK